MKIDHESLLDQVGPIPPHIQAAANVCLYNLMHGPSWVRVPAAGVEAFTDNDLATFRDDLELAAGDKLEETYLSAPANALRSWLDDLPAALYFDESGYVLGESAPEGEWLDAEGDPCSEDTEGAEWYEGEAWGCLDHADIVAALFGKTFSREFR